MEDVAGIGTAAVAMITAVTAFIKNAADVKASEKKIMKQREETAALRKQEHDDHETRLRVLELSFGEMKEVKAELKTLRSDTSEIKGMLKVMQDGRRNK